MKAKITTFLDGLITYDYILFGSVFGLFILLIILSILLRKKIALAVFILLLAFSTLFIAPMVGYIEMHKYLFKNSIKLIKQKKLNFTQAVVIKAEITNESKFIFSECLITAKASKHTKNRYKNYIYSFKPFQKMSILEHNISMGETRYFKMIVEPFTYSKDYNISLKADCK